MKFERFVPSEFLRFVLFSIGLLIMSAADAQQAELKLSLGSDEVHDIAMLADHQGFLSFSRTDKRIIHWDIATGKLVHSFEGHHNPISQITLLPDGNRFLTYAYHELYLWDVKDRRLVKSFDEPEGTFYHGILVMPDGRHVLAFGGKSKGENTSETVGVINQLDIETGKIVHAFEGHRGYVRSIVFMADGRNFLSVSDDKMIKLWDGGSGSLIRSFLGHSMSIKGVYLAADGQTFISHGSDKRILRWDIATGEVIRSTTVHSNVLKLVILPNDRGLLGSVEGGIKSWDMDLNEQPIQSSAIPVAWKKIKGNFLSPEIHSDGSVDHWSFETGLVTTWYPLPGGKGYLSGLYLLDNSGNVVSDMRSKELPEIYEQPRVLIGATKNSFVWTINGSLEQRNIVTGKLIKKFQGHSESAKSVTRHPGSEDFLIEGDYYLHEWDLANGKITRSYFGGGRNELQFLPDGKSFLASSGFQVMHWDGSTGSMIHSIPGNIGVIYEIKLLPDGTSFLAIGENGIAHFDIATTKRIHFYEGMADEVTSILLSRDGKFFFSVSRDKTTRLWDVNSGKLLFSSVSSKNESATTRHLTIHPNSTSFFQDDGEKTITHFDLGGKVLHTYSAHSIISVLPDGDSFLSTDGVHMTHWEISTGKLLHTFPNASIIQVHPDGKSLFLATGITAMKHFDLLTGDLLHTFDGQGDAVNQILILPDGNTLLSGSLGFGDGYKPVKLWEVRSGKLLHSYSVHESSRNDIRLLPDGQGFLTIGNDQIIKHWDFTTGKLRNSFPVAGDVSDVKFVDDGASFLASTSVGTVHYISLDKGEEVVRYIARRSVDFVAQIGTSVNDLYLPKDYITLAPDGYYMGTKKGVTDLVHFVVGNTPYMFDQFDLQYNRPDLVLERIGKVPKELIDSYRRAHEKRLNKMGFNPLNFEKDRTFNVPEVQIAETYPETTDQPKLQLGVNAKDKLFHLNRINVFMNGVPVYGTKGMDVVEANSQALGKTLALTLASGKNLIEISVVNEKGVESLKERIEIEYVPKVVKKPSLYVVNIGVSQYKNSTMNLAYADKDAQDVRDAFRTKVDLFENVIPITLLNGDVTVENIKKIKKTLLKTLVDDRVIISFSGHGLLDSKLDYYLAMHDVNFSNPSEHGLAYEVLEDLLDGIPARYKILFMDACHSGEIDKEEVIASVAVKAGAVKFSKAGDQTIEKKTIGLKNSFELMQELFTDLRRSTGTTSISSSSGTQISLEDSKYRNGIFTYCILSGLKEQKADSDHDGKIMLSELKGYVQRRVSELTDGKQQPTSRIENIENDWQIW